MLYPLPQDLLFLIFTRLPLKSLLRLRSVCKSWHSTIGSPDFIIAHVNQSNAGNNNLSRLFCFRDKNKELHFELRRHDDESVGNTGCLEIELPFRQRNENFRVLGCCNGVICLVGNHRCILWNPSIKKYVIFPKPPHTVESKEMESLGFGSDSKTGDYKVLRLAYAVVARPQPPPDVELYTLSSGCWRKISGNALGRCRIAGNREIFMNGAVHWFGYYAGEDRGSKSVFIVSFDMENEVFRTMHMPESLARKYSTDPIKLVRLFIASYRGLLSVFDVVSWGYRECCYIWVMEKYGVEDSWTVLFKVDDPPGGIWCIVGYARNGEVVLEMQMSSENMQLDVAQRSQIGMYDPQSKQIKVLEKGLSFVDNCMESLVLLEGAKCKKYPWSKRKVWDVNRTSYSFLSLLQMLYKALKNVINDAI